MRQRHLLISACAMLCLAASALAQVSGATALAVPPDALLTYVGTYTLPGGETLRILIKDEHLIGIDPAGESSTLRAKSQMTFVSDAGGQIEFVKSEKGVVDHISAAGGALDIKKVVVAPEVIAKYAGRYVFPAGNVQITADGGVLFYQFTGQSRTVVFPRSNASFFSADGSVTLDFDFENGSPVLVIRGSGAEQRAARQQP